MMVVDPTSIAAYHPYRRITHFSQFDSTTHGSHFTFAEMCAYVAGGWIGE